MLQKLHIAHYALISKLDIDFHTGFSVITGETGAGKSIVLGALGLLLGQRADAKSIRTGASKCVVEGTFDLSHLNLEHFFAEADIDFDGSECIIRREITQAGKSRAFINDTPVALAQLKALAPHIIDIHSQHQNLLMGSENFLLDTLDCVADNATLRQDYGTAHAAYTKAKRALQDLREQLEREQTDTDYLRFQLQQIDDAAFTEGEQEALEQESEVLSHAEEIKQALYQVQGLLSDERNPLTAVLRQATQSLNSIGRVLPDAETLAERLQTVRIEVEDILQETEHTLDSVDFDPERLSYVDDRLGTLYDLQKKHRLGSITELLQLADDLRQRLDRIDNSDEHLQRCEKEVKQLHTAMTKAAKALTDSRTAAAAKAEALLTEGVRSLGMPHAQISLWLTPRETPDASGADAAAFLFSANKGVPMQNVASIASGGEIARLMLALKGMVAAHRHLPTIVFDEIDTGVSGTMAEKMASAMRQMAAHCQVLCITHLPQIAALGAEHYCVRKHETPEGTTSLMEHLTEEERVSEIANMLSGETLTEAAIRNAQSLLAGR